MELKILTSQIIVSLNCIISNNCYETLHHKKDLSDSRNGVSKMPENHCFVIDCKSYNYPRPILSIIVLSANIKIITPNNGPNPFSFESEWKKISFYTFFCLHLLRRIFHIHQKLRIIFLKFSAFLCRKKTIKNFKKIVCNQTISDLNFKWVLKKFWNNLFYMVIRLIN